MLKIIVSIIFLISVHAENPTINLRGIKVYVPEGRIETEGIVNMNTGLIELLATTPNGKEHESILVVYCNPALLQSALLMLDLDPESATNNSIFIYVRWKSNDTIITKRAEEVISDKKNNSLMASTQWTFSGSRFIEDSRTGKNIFAANINGVLVATYYDPDAIINNPLPESKDDTVYYANEKTLPEKGTSVTLIFSKKELTTTSSEK